MHKELNEQTVLDQIEKTESSVSHIELAESDDLEKQVSKKLIEIENRFNIEIHTVDIKLDPLDLTFPAPELIGWQYTGTAGTWNNIKIKYNEVKRLDDLDAKHESIGLIIDNVKLLAGRFPDSPSLKRVLAYFYSILEEWDEALRNYQEASIQSENAEDWLDVAVSALKVNKEELACHSLEKFFLGVPINEEPQVWSVHVNLIEKFNNLPAFHGLCKTDEYDIIDNEIAILLETAIYLLKKTGVETLASEITGKWLTGESVNSLLTEACHKLDGQPIESYRRFLVSMNAQLSIMSISNEDLYKKAQDVRQMGNLDTAEIYYQECIKREVNRDAATNSLSAVLVQLGRAPEAVDLLEKSRPDVKNKNALENQLINVYQHHTGQHAEAIKLLKEKLKSVPKEETEKQARILWQIANSHIKLENYQDAIDSFGRIDKLSPNNITLKRNIAFCYWKKGQDDTAKEILIRIQNTSPDAKTAELLKVIEGKIDLDPNNIVSKEFSSREPSGFAKFFLDRCRLEGTQQTGREKFVGEEHIVKREVERLEDAVKGIGAEKQKDDHVYNPEARAGYMLSAAKIYFDVGSDRQTFQYLCRSLSSRGDYAAKENHLDTARECYYEALIAYDGFYDSELHQSYFEQDPVNALSRFLLSILGRENIPTSPPDEDRSERTLDQQSKFINDTVEKVISECPEKNKVFDSITYLLGSQFANMCILSHLYDKQELRRQALNYLQDKGINTSSIRSLQEFTSLWRHLQHKNISEVVDVSIQLKTIQEKFELSENWLTQTLERINSIDLTHFSEQDKLHIQSLINLFDKYILALCRVENFDARESQSDEIDKYCHRLLEDIEKDPTRLSIEYVYNIIKTVQKHVKIDLEERYNNSKPDLSIDLSVKSYPAVVGQQIEIRVEVKNESGRSRARDVHLVIPQNTSCSVATSQDIRLNDDLIGGEKKHLSIPLQLIQLNIDRGFSLPISVEYRTRTGELKSINHTLPIELYSKDGFEDIPNFYNNGTGVVHETNMFVGRQELITNVASRIQRPGRQNSECVLIYGQKRSGKTSILHHLEVELKKDPNLLILNVGDIATTLGYESDSPEDPSLSYSREFIKQIFLLLKLAIDDRVGQDVSPIKFDIPDECEVDKHVNPQRCFHNTFLQFNRCISTKNDWRDVRAVLLIDEFQYIYQAIIDNRIPDDFMKFWKALFGANHFDAVLIGQDVMPKFIDRYPNQFAIAYDERITYLSNEHAEKLIENPIRIGDWENGESRYCEQSVQKILDLTAGSPFYIQKICYNLVNHLNSPNEKAIWVTDAHVDYIKDELINSQKLRISLGENDFENLIDSGDTSENAIPKENALKVLKVIADNSSKVSPCHRNNIVCDSLSTTKIDEILNDLVQREVVEHDSDHYHIRVGLFKEWLVVNG